MDFVLSKLTREGVIGWLIGLLVVILGFYVTSLNTHNDTNGVAITALQVRLTAAEQRTSDLDIRLTTNLSSSDTRLTRIETKLDELLERK
jgi:hypothetical protein